jgi:hypothetical protein
VSLPYASPRTTGSWTRCAQRNSLTCRSDTPLWNSGAWRPAERPSEAYRSCSRWLSAHGRRDPHPLLARMACQGIWEAT